MNAMVTERFPRRNKKQVGQIEPQAEVWILPQRLNAAVNNYFHPKQEPKDAGQWVHQPEIPTAREILGLSSERQPDQISVQLAPNQVLGAWKSKDEYLGTQYQLLREDAVAPLRQAVLNVRNNPAAQEDDFDGKVGIYEKVRIVGFTCSSRGLATRVMFSIARAGKKILWEQSKRLIQGSLVIMTPSDDMFKSRAVVAIVAARPLSGLQQNPPELDLFVSRIDDLELDAAVDWVIVEARSSFYEAERHTLLALQKMMSEPFPLKEHLIDVQSEIPAPAYVKDAPVLDLTSVLINNKKETYEKVDILRGWPAEPQSELDASQLDALRRILAKQLAIVQGPPGTGKTFVSVQAIKIRLGNWKEGDPPIILACQTNHALDQLLRHVAEFEPGFIRLGGRSKDKEIIKPRTLHEVRRSTSEPPLPGCQAPAARKRRMALEKDLEALLAPLAYSKHPLDHRKLQELNLLSKAQAQSLEAGASQWVQAELSNPKEARSPFLVWLAKSIISIPSRPEPEDFGFNCEDADLEFEQLKEIEAENFAKDDDEIDALKGVTFHIADNFTCRKHITLSDKQVQEVLKKEQDVWKIPEGLRGAIYNHLQKELKNKVLVAFRQKAKEYNEQTRRYRIGLWEKDETILRQQKIIGMTTTGLSKYRGLIAALGCKIVLIEEAAETLEAPVIAACLPSLQHLILVGDHKQLRPHCHVKELEDEPWFLNISLFERMVLNHVKFDTLQKQRRMIPEIRRILHPIYHNLIKDHASVQNPANRPDVPGMGGINSFFFTHQWTEQRDDFMSCINAEEAQMIAGFVEHLVYNGMKTEDITILTFYNGQRKRILSSIRKSHSLTDSRIKVVTVDSYQGEENKVVILSLVRSNDNGSIGFLQVDNRVCVALSRAQCGFYMFGNGKLLYKFETWKKVIDIMAGNKRKATTPTIMPKRVHTTLPIVCKNHKSMVEIGHASDWQELSGGCKAKCKENLACGHPCSLTCHPFSHDFVPCQQQCVKTLACGHICSALCSESCVCLRCRKPTPQSRQAIRFTQTKDGGGLTSDTASSVESWQTFAREESQLYAAQLSTAKLSSARPPTVNTTSNLQCPQEEATKTLAGDFQLISFDDSDGTIDTLRENKSPRIQQEQTAWTTLSMPASSSSHTERMIATERQEPDAQEWIAVAKDWSCDASLLD